MPANHVSVVLVHGAWANGSSWSKVNGPLKADGMKVVAAPLPLTSLADDIAALGRVLERLDGPVVLAGHAYGSAVIAETRDPKVASLVYIAGLAPEEGETVGDVFSCGQPHPKAPELKPDLHGLVWLPEAAFAEAFAQSASPEEQAILAAVQRPIDVACISVPVERPLWKDGSSWVLVAEYDRMINPETQQCAHAQSTTRRWSPHPQTSQVILDAVRDVAPTTRRPTRTN